MADTFGDPRFRFTATVEGPGTLAARLLARLKTLRTIAQAETVAAVMLRAAGTPCTVELAGFHPYRRAHVTTRLCRTSDGALEVEEGSAAA